MVGYDSFADGRLQGFGVIVDFDPHAATKGAKLRHFTIECPLTSATAFVAFCPSHREKGQRSLVREHHHGISPRPRRPVDRAIFTMARENVLVTVGETI